jgi:hypothetical protein
MNAGKQEQAIIPREVLTMLKPLVIVLALITLVAPRAPAQVPARRSSVRAAGQASVFVTPDQVKVDASIVTQGVSAQDAASQNAGQVAAVITALTKVLGPSADIKTVNYFVGPVYKYPSGGGPGTIAGYTASMTVEVTLGTISMTGLVIDTATQAGATSIGSLQFSLKDPEPAQLQALRMATMQAKSHADAIAGGLGRTVGAVISLEEGSAVSVQPNIAGAAGAATATTVQPGLIEVRASVVLEAELI